MAYNEILSNRVREALVHLPDVREIAMFGGLCFMVDNKMCIGIMKDELMCRIDPENYEEMLEKNGCHPMHFTGRTMKGIVCVDETGMRTKADFMYWVHVCLAYNPKAKAAKKKK